MGKGLLGSAHGGHLTRAQCHWAMAEIVGGRATDAQLAAFLVGLRAKGETADEVIGLVEAMLEASVPLPYEGRRSTSSAPAATGAIR